MPQVQILANKDMTIYTDDIHIPALSCMMAIYIYLFLHSYMYVFVVTHLTTHNYTNKPTSS